MRVLFLCHRELDTQIGGVAEFLAFLPISLKKSGVESVIYAQANHKTLRLSAPTYLENGIVLYTGPFVKPQFFSSNKNLIPLIELCHIQKIDLIHAQGLYRSGYMAMQIHRKLNIPYIITSHSDVLGVSSERIKRFSVKMRCKKILKQAAAVTHLTPIMADASHQIYSTKEKSYIIGNGIDLPAWEHDQNKTEQNYLLAIGRLEREKGFHVLIDAYASLKKNGIHTSLVIAGAGSFEKQLQSQVKKLGLNLVTDFHDFSNMPSDSIIFTGYIRGNAKKHLFSHAKIILFSPQPFGWDEAFPIVQLETMAAGKPLIASDIAASRYLKTLGLQANLVKAEDAAEWSQEIRKLMLDDEQQKKSGEKNRENAKQFDWDVVAEKYREVYCNAVAK